MNVLVCGSRDWTDEAAIAERLSTLPVDCTVIEGGARGADSIAGRLALKRGLTVRIFAADWERDGKRAGVLRNLQMLDEQPALVIAFRSPGRSRGTDHTISEARKRGIPVEVITA